MNSIGLPPSHSAKQSRGPRVRPGIPVLRNRRTLLQMETRSRRGAPADAKQNTLCSRAAEKKEMNGNPTPKLNEIATIGRRRAEAYPITESGRSRELESINGNASDVSTQLLASAD
ncbi:hypothetical protein M758_9G067800 [Ceratodon purpureus]|nr:hypothetical protein M758_9G067800 [Ceratodon purpureus]